MKIAIMGYSGSGKSTLAQKLGEHYQCDFVIDKVERGLRELRTKRKHYEKYNPSNGWGDINSIK